MNAKASRKTWGLVTLGGTLIYSLIQIAYYFVAIEPALAKIAGTH